MSYSAREWKIQRLAEGNRPRVVDLFSGCGGISLGFHAAGYDIIANIELDKHAAASHALNFHSHLDSEQFEAHSKDRNILMTEPEDLLKELYPGEEPASLVDVLVGGPPCQAFARVGRAKLREVAQHPEAFRLDPRGNLYLRYLDYVRRLQPLAVLMENVPDVLNYGGHNVPQEIAEVLSDLGYSCWYTLLNAVHYGVPQTRERLFLVAVTKELGREYHFPTPTNWYDLPIGYESTRKVFYQRFLAAVEGDEGTCYVSPPIARQDLLPHVSVQDAVGDLAPITEHLEGKLRRGAKRFNTLSPYAKSTAHSDYVRLMRAWPLFEGGEGVYDHVIRYLPRDYPIFRRMQPGDQYPEAHAVAEELFNERLRELQSTGAVLTPEDVADLYKKMVPPYDVGKFPNKWRKLDRREPSRTLMAHLGKDGYSHIHFSDEQARTISVREAARLQSFPDGFRFAGSMNAALRQIGNAVPPLLAKALAEQLRHTLGING